MLKTLFKTADKLFINVSKEFELQFCDGYYTLPNLKNPSCHILEIALISNFVFSGNKIKDLMTVLEVSPKWILGFYDGFKNLNPRFNNLDYIKGHYIGCKADELSIGNVQEASI